eukprot:1450184-Pyramimonas_sp.AAC.1
MTRAHLACPSPSPPPPPLRKGRGPDRPARVGIRPRLGDLVWHEAGPGHRGSFSQTSSSS